MTSWQPFNREPKASKRRALRIRLKRVLVAAGMERV